MKFSISNVFTEDLAVDMGSVRTLICGRGRGMVVNEPSLVAIDKLSGEVIAAGTEALEMLGRSPEDVEVAYPMRDGVVADSELTQTMLKKFVRKARGGRARISRRIIQSVPTGITPVERGALRDVIQRIGASRVYLVDEGLAAALGVRLPVTDMKASMVVDIGGATTSITVVANAGIVDSEMLKIGGLDMDREIAEYIKHERKVLIGERTAERLKMVLGSATEPLEDHKSMLKGQRLAGDGPAMIEVSSAEITQAIDGVLRQIAQAVRAVIERVPPEVAGDLSDQGMVLTGGMALLAGIDARLEAETNLKVRIAESPRQSVAQGLISLYEQPLMLRRVTRNV